jgi:hypothetical protein
MSAETHALIHDLPGEEYVREGFADLAAHRESVAALLIEIAAPRLRLAGLSVPEIPARTVDAEIRLYRLLGQEFGNEAHSQYNALLRRVASLASALEMRSSSPPSNP